MSEDAYIIRVLVVDDDPVFRRIICQIFEQFPQAKVVSAVPTVTAAKAAVEARQIDLVTLDVVLKDESGLDFLPWVTKSHPNVVVAILTSGTQRHMSSTVDAILMGAATLILKPSGAQAAESLRKSLSRVVEDLTASRAKCQIQTVRKTLPTSLEREVVAIGASTGGPPVVINFLKSLSLEYELPILITQHLAAEHVGAFVSMLSYAGGRPVVAARHGEALSPSTVYVANDNKHLKIERREGRLFIVQDDGPEELFCRPAVNVMLASVAEVCGDACIGIVMTGMGSDGARGAAALRAKGAPVLVQDQASSVVWGMPGAVIALGAASAVFPADGLAAGAAARIALPQRKGKV